MAKGKKIKKASNSGLYYDFEQPYRYTRHFEEDGTKKLIVGGFDDKTGTSSSWQSLNKLNTMASADSS